MQDVKTDWLPSPATGSAIMLRSVPVAMRPIRGSRKPRQADTPDPAASAVAITHTATIWFDYTDLVHYFAHNRLPTGIQRVQIELFRVSLLRPDHARIGACTFDPARRCWTTVPPELLAAICAASVRPEEADGGDGVVQPGGWEQLTQQLARTVASAAPTPFAPGDVLVNIGSSWWIPNYMRYVRHQQREAGLLYAPFVHDCIPIKTPECCSSELVAEFRDWFSEAMETADVVLANSQCTANDVKQVALELDCPAPEPHVVRLDARMEARLPESGPALDRLTATVHARHGIAGPFALFVATIEVRKNHIFVFQCWKRLIDTLGADAVPDLVCVGKQGWLVEFTLNWLRVHSHLAGKVRLVGSVSDLDLAALYRSCMFSVYCSFYEGWGLPVTESLSHGRVALVPDHSSLPEAGGAFAAYYRPGSADSFCEQVQTLLEPFHRARMEAAIRARFRPRAWEDVLDQVLATVRQPPAWQPAIGQPLRHNAGLTVLPGRTYSFAAGRPDAAEDDGPRRGQRMQHGLGWWQSETWGCWSRLAEAHLLFSMPADAPARSHIYLLLRGGPIKQAVQVEAGRHVVHDVTLSINQRRLVRLPLDRPGEAGLLVRISAPLYSLADHTGGGDPRDIGFGIEAAAVIGRDDVAGRCEMLEWMLMAD